MCHIVYLKLLILVPEAPKVAVYPVYSAETGRLTSLKTEWMELVNLNVLVVHTFYKVSVTIL